MIRQSYLYKTESPIDKIYKKLEKGLIIYEKPEYSNLVNFSENLNLPRHRWFNIKEGFSAKIIKELIKRFDGKEEDLVFDPFCGSGTTLLAAKELNIESFGFEINPFFALLSRIKLINKKVNLSKYIIEIKRLKIKENLTPPKLSISKKLFNNQLSEILTIREYITTRKRKLERDLLKIAFICSLEKSSTAKKDGNGLKYPKNKKTIPFKEAIIQKIKEIKEDINNFQLGNAESIIFNEDVRDISKKIKEESKIKEYVGKVTFSIFSPPYMNCFDYSEVYKTELWFGNFIKDYPDLKELRNSSLDSHLNKSLNNIELLKNKYVTFFSEIIAKKELWSKKIPLMIEGYFEDMWKTMEGIYNLLEDKGYCIIIVGNSAYGNIVVPTDLILGRIGLDIGFSNCKIEIARHLGTSSQQYKKINNRNLLRESLVILQK